MCTSNSKGISSSDGIVAIVDELISAWQRLCAEKVLCLYRKFSIAAVAQLSAAGVHSSSSDAQLCMASAHAFSVLNTCDCSEVLTFIVGDRWTQIYYT